MTSDVRTGDGLLRGALDRAGMTPYGWLAEPLVHHDGPVLDLMCACAPTREVLRHTRWIGLDPSAAALAAGAAAHRGPLVRGLAQELPIGRDALAAVYTAMWLPLARELDTVFAEIRRVLRPGGTLVALVPSRPGATLAELRIWRPLNRALGAGRGWPVRSARDQLGWHLAAADFAVLSDDRRTFRLPVPDGASATTVADALEAAGLCPPGMDPAALRRAREVLVRWSAPGRKLPIPLRRLVARR